jgi:hypothetical protein
MPSSRLVHGVVLRAAERLSDEACATEVTELRVRDLVR